MRDIHNQWVIWEIPRAFPHPSLSPLYTTHNHGVSRYWDIKANILLPQSCLISSLSPKSCFWHDTIFVISRYIEREKTFWATLGQSVSHGLWRQRRSQLTFWLLQSVSNSENPQGLPPLLWPEFVISDVNHSNIGDLNKQKIKKQNILLQSVSISENPRGLLVPSFSPSLLSRIHRPFHGDDLRNGRKCLELINTMIWIYISLNVYW